MSGKGIPTREMRPLRRVVDRHIATLSGAEERGDHCEDVLECGHHEPVRASTAENAKMRRCSTCAPMLPVERGPDPMATVKRKGRHGR